ncbi:unnamed protein product [Allacma fusca]|uniref:Uncharacterized protein n=1 Tax=Allacma fusca TaxID=39272 RepID=A0A8J2PDT6_9HEXA|nr:unnamed protein product [Allacma fusca]
MIGQANRYLSILGCLSLGQRENSIVVWGPPNRKIFWEKSLATLISGLFKLNFTHEEIQHALEPEAKSWKVIEAQHLDESFLEVVEDYNINTDTVSRTKRDSEPRSTKKETFTKTFQDIIEYVRTDGHPGHPPSGGIGWIAFIILFATLSPILLPMLFSPLVLFLIYIVLLPSVIYTSEAGAGGE